MFNSAAVEVIAVPLIDKASVSKVPSTSTSPEMSKEATTAVPVRVGEVSDLFVRVCEPVSVATVESIASVTPLPLAVEVTPVPPNTLKASESKSIAMLVVPSVRSRS